MATFVVGDIHGHLRALEDLLDRLQAEVAGDDRVVFLGDYIDRGPSTKGCVEAILTIRHNVKSEVVTLVGNHEDSLLRTDEGTRLMSIAQESGKRGVQFWVQSRQRVEGCTRSS